MLRDIIYLVITLKKLCIKLIKTYQAKSNPHKHRCRYYPSCSYYGLISYERYNIVKASFLTLFRILRCNPLFKGGYDPVPEKRAKLKKIKDGYYFLEYRENTDRPNLVYIYNENGSIAIDAGNSKKHINLFYKELKKNKLPLPKTTIITHHHWDHTFAMNYTNTKTIGLEETNNHLKRQQQILQTSGIKKLFELKEIPAFCVDHIKLEYKHKMKKIEIKTLDETILNKLELGDLLIFKFPSNHTNDNLVVLDKKSKILFLGDALYGEIIDYDFVKDNEIITMQKTVLSNLDFEYALESHSNIKTKEELLTKLRNEWRD